jgi:hypothetical protein
MIKIQLDACTEVTVESAYGYSRETEVRDLIKIFAEASDEELLAMKQVLLNNVSRTEEVLREQLYFAQETISNIKETIRRLGDKPLREPAREALKSISYEIDNSMFEL